MSRYFIPLTQAQPKNALLDFSPINQGLNAIGEAKQQATRNAMMQDELQMRKEQNQFQRDRATAQDEQARRERGGKMAAAIMQMPDNDPGKQGAWRRYLSEFGDGNHSPEELDFRTGPKIAAAAFGHVVDPIDRKIKEAQLSNLNSQIASRGAEKFEIVNTKDGHVLRVPKAGGDASTIYSPSPQDPSAITDPKDRAKAEDDLRKDFQNVTKDFRTIRDSYSVIKSAGSGGNPAGDLSMIYAYMKMLDPGSVVRESEFEMAAKSGSLPRQFQNLANKALTGTLTGETRADFLRTADTIYKQRERDYTQSETQFRDIAGRRSVDSRNVIPDYRYRPPSDAPQSQPDAPIRARNANGDVIEWNGSQWVPVR